MMILLCVVSYFVAGFITLIVAIYFEYKAGEYISECDGIDVIILVVTWPLFVLERIIVGLAHLPTKMREYLKRGEK